MSTKKRTVSLIIPCYYKHAKYLYKLLAELEKQTILPDEVILPLSGIENVPKHIIRNLKDREWIFPVYLIPSVEKLFKGSNLNRVAGKVKGDIVMIQDADDFSHPQRIEITKYLFETFDVNHLIVGCGQVDYSKRYNLEQLSYSFFDDFSETWHYGPLHYGAIAIRHEVFSKIKWTNQPRGQDVEFNEMVYENFDRCMVAFEDLYEYRPGLSSLSFIEKGRKYLMKREKSLRLFYRRWMLFSRKKIMMKLYK